MSRDIEPLFIGHETYAWILEVFMLAGFGNEGTAWANIARVMNLDVNGQYFIVLPGFRWDKESKTAVKDERPLVFGGVRRITDYWEARQ